MESRLLRILMVYISVNLLYVYCSLNMVIRRIPIIQKFILKSSFLLTTDMSLDILVNDCLNIFPQNTTIQLII